MSRHYGELDGHSADFTLSQKPMGGSVPKLHVRHLFGRVRPRTWRFEDGLDQTKAQSVADVRVDMVLNSEHWFASTHFFSRPYTAVLSEQREVKN